MCNSKQDDGDSDIYSQIFQFIVDREEFLSEEIGYNHDDKVAEERCPCRTEISYMRNKQNVKSDGYDDSDNREIRSVLGFVSQFVPKRKIEENALEEV